MAGARVEPLQGFVDVRDGKIHYLDWEGEGPRVHFLHANGFCAGTYTPIIRALNESLRVMASDVRGHGDSVQIGIPKITHWNLFAEDLRTLIEKKLTPPVIGIGHSLGAVVTCIAASKYPHLFSGIVLMDPVFLPRPLLWTLAVMRTLGIQGAMPLAKGARRRKRSFKGKTEAFNRFTAGRGIFKTWQEDFIDAYLECGLLEKTDDDVILKCDPELEARIFESVPLNEWRHAGRIKCPVLAIRGAESDTFMEAPARTLEKTIPDMELVTLERAGHFVPMEQPEACTRLILDFIQRRIRPER
ncbi:MAG: hypothetical protein CSA22_00560 [Deltaproteobacteria bacterium]|nr:MAG: hypothetical protein CSA22_00560 [Deltaproteobacteria bacterium]